MNIQDKFDLHLSQLPLVGILRGITPEEILTVGATLDQEGWGLIEIPLNSPDPIQSIALLAAHQPQSLVGAGTVLTPQQVREVHAAGGQLVVSPNFDAAVVAEAQRRGLICLPGVMTPSEAFAALACGAQGLKLFPAELISPAALKALRAVLPQDTRLLPVGGITPDSMTSYRSAGASGFGIGSALYKPGMSADQVREQARRFSQAWRLA